MVEPTESESLKELDKFIAAMKSIKKEIDEIKDGKADAKDNVLHNAPHTVGAVTADEWSHSYGRKKQPFRQNGWKKINSGLRSEELMTGMVTESGVYQRSHRKLQDRKVKVLGLLLIFFILMNCLFFFMTGNSFFYKKLFLNFISGKDFNSI